MPETTITRPYCLRCEVPIYEDHEGVWRREATGSQACPRNPAGDGHEPAPVSSEDAGGNRTVFCADCGPVTPERAAEHDDHHAGGKR